VISHTRVAAGAVFENTIGAARSDCTGIQLPTGLGFRTKINRVRVRQKSLIRNGFLQITLFWLAGISMG
jgi:hypothetical protein